MNELEQENRILEKAMNRLAVMLYLASSRLEQVAANSTWKPVSRFRTMRDIVKNLYRDSEKVEYPEYCIDDIRAALQEIVDNE